jgi:hypothetical protein
VERGRGSFTIDKVWGRYTVASLWGIHSLLNYTQRNGALAGGPVWASERSHATVLVLSKPNKSTKQGGGHARCARPISGSILHPQVE